MADFKYIISMEAHKPDDTYIILAFNGKFYEATQTSALYLDQKFHYKAVKYTLLGVGDYIQSGFPPNALLRPLDILKKEYEFPDHPGMCLYKLPDGDHCPPQSAVAPFLASHIEHHTELRLAREAREKAAHQPTLFTPKAIEVAPLAQPYRGEVAPLVQPYRGSVAPTAQHNGSVAPTAQQKPIPQKVHRLPPEPHGLPIVHTATLFLNYWLTVKSKLNSHVAQYYDDALHTAIGRMKTVAITLYESRSFATKDDRHRLFMELQEQLTVIYTILDTFEQNKYLHTRQLQVLIGQYLQLRRHYFTWRSRSNTC